MAVLDSLTRKLRYRKIFPLLEEVEKSYDRPLKILDAGGASGNLHEILKSRGHTVFVLDFIEGDCVDFVCDLEEKLPFKDKEFDLLVSLAVVEHLHNWRAALEEFIRVSNNVIVTSPTRLGKPVLEFLALLRLVNKEHIDDHKHYLSGEDFYKAGYNYRTFMFRLNGLAWKFSRNVW